MVHFASPIPHSPRLASPRLTHDREVDLGLPAAQLVFHHQCVAATVLLARCQDGELAAALTVLHFDVLALLDLRVKAGVRMEAPPRSTPRDGWDTGQGVEPVPSFLVWWCILVMPLLGEQRQEDAWELQPV